MCLEGANLEKAFFPGANLKAAHFHGAHLKGARLVGANLEVAVLSEANLEGMSFAGANLKGANIEMLETRLAGDDDDGFTVEARWNVAGSVGHWGHIHQRSNGYHANITVEDIDGAWKLTGLEILQEERL